MLSVPNRTNIFWRNMLALVAKILASRIGQGAKASHDIRMIFQHGFLLSRVLE